MSVSGINYDLSVPANFKFDPAKDRVLPLIQALCDPPGEWEQAGEPDYVPTGKKGKANGAGKKKKAEADKEEIWMNYDFCCACGRGGRVICCERCPMSYHLACLVPPLKKKDIPEGEWICGRCEEMKRRDAGGEPIPEKLKELIPLERKEAIEGAEKPKPQRPERAAKEEKPARGGRRRKYAFEPVLQRIKKYRRDEQRSLDIETRFFEEIIVEKPSPQPKSKRKWRSKPKCCKWSRKKKHTKRDSNAPKKPAAPRKPRKPVFSDDEKPPVKIVFSSEKIRRKIVGCGERVILAAMDAIICAATIDNEDGFSVTDDICRVAKDPTSFVEPEPFIPKVRKPRKNAKAVPEPSPPPEELPDVPPVVDQNHLDVLREDGVYQPALAEMNRRTASPVVFSQRQDDASGCASRSHEEEMRTPSPSREYEAEECVSLSTASTDYSEDEEEPVSLAHAFERVRDDMSLQTVERHLVLNGIPRMYPQNFFPGDPRRDALHGGNEVAPCVMTEHILSRNEHGRAPLLCNQCSESCLTRPLIQCDYCPKYYHLDCIDPPFVEPPKTLWMCKEHPIRGLEELTLKDLRRSGRVKLWRKEISVPLDESRIIVDFMRKIERPRAPNSLTDPREADFEEPAVMVHPAVAALYESSEDEEEVQSDNMATEAEQDPVIAPGPSGSGDRPTAEEENLFLEAIARLQGETFPEAPQNERESEPGCSGESSSGSNKKVWYGKCDEYGDPGPSSRMREELAPFLPLQPYSDDDDVDLNDVEGPGWAFKLKEDPKVAAVMRMLDPPKEPEPVEEEDDRDVCLLHRGRGREVKLRGEDILILGCVKKARDFCEELKEISFSVRADFEEFLRELMGNFRFSKDVTAFIPWNLLREARIDLGKGHRAIVRCDEPPEEEILTAKEEKSHRSEPAESEPVFIGTRAPVELPPLPVGVSDPIGELMKTMSPERKEELLKNFLVSHFSKKDECKPESERVKPTAAELQQMCPEAGRHKVPLALLTPLSKDLEVDGEPVPIFSHSIIAGVGPGAYLQLDKYGPKKCQFIDNPHAVIAFHRRKNRFELLNHSKYGTFVDEKLYTVGFLKDLEEKIVPDGEMCGCGLLPTRKSKGLVGWMNLAAPLAQGSVLKFGCVSFLFSLYGNPPVAPSKFIFPLSDSEDSDDDDYEDAEMGDYEDELLVLKERRANCANLNLLFESEEEEEDEEEEQEEETEEELEEPSTPAKKKRGRKLQSKSSSKGSKKVSQKSHDPSGTKSTPRKTRSMIQMRLTSTPK